jgi:hypothetical protein
LTNNTTSYHAARTHEVKELLPKAAHLPPAGNPQSECF